MSLLNSTALPRPQEEIFAGRLASTMVVRAGEAENSQASLDSVNQRSSVWGTCTYERDLQASRNASKTNDFYHRRQYYSSVRIRTTLGRNLPASVTARRDIMLWSSLWEGSSEILCNTNIQNRNTLKDNKQCTYTLH